jgi:SAM-dependent MidA family methyltransferase
MLELPEPNASAKAHSQALVDIIRSEIRAAEDTASIGFDRFMELALYQPGFGYYSAGGIKFGAAGDFVTAPQISAIFAQCIARQCVPILRELQGGSILEFGAGSGILAAEILETLEQLGQLPQRYYILELSGELRQRQTRTLQAQVAHLFPMITWLDSMPEPGFRGVVLANEVLDAMPVRCFSLGSQIVLERRVGIDADGLLGWREQPADAELTAAVRSLQDQLPEVLSPGYCSELNWRLGAWMRALADSLSQAVILLIDYGYPRREYYQPERSQGTLLCHYRHRAHSDPFFYPGLQDISANVDFTAVAEVGEAAGLSLLGYTTQAHFLLASGVDEIFAILEDETRRLRYSQQIKRLTMPSEMGERFQVMALGKAFHEPLRGFALRDLRFRL